jgi:hypothetical protein
MPVGPRKLSVIQVILTESEMAGKGGSTSPKIPSGGKGPSGGGVGAGKSGASGKPAGKGPSGGISKSGKC